MAVQFQVEMGDTAEERANDLSFLIRDAVGRMSDGLATKNWVYVRKQAERINTFMHELRDAVRVLESCDGSPRPKKSDTSRERREK